MLILLSFVNVVEHDFCAQPDQAVTLRLSTPQSSAARRLERQFLSGSLEQFGVHRILAGVHHKVLIRTSTGRLLMFVRMVSAKLKVNQHKQFSELFQNKVMAMVRKERGFRDMMLLGVSGAPEVVAISFWDSRETMEASEKNLSPKIQEMLFAVLEGPPEVKTFMLAYSTMHDVPAEQMLAFQNQAAITTPIPGVGGG